MRITFWHKALITCFGVALAYALWFALIGSRPQDVLVQRVEPQTLTQLLAVVGRAQPQESLDVRPQSAGLARELLVDEGQSVTQGQVIAIIEAPEEFAAIDRANADVAARTADANARRGEISGRQSDVARQLGELAARRADVGRLEADLAGKQASADLARANLRRVEVLADRGFASRAALDAARAEARSSEAAIANARAAIASSRSGVAAAQAAVDAAQASVRTAQSTVLSAEASVSAAEAGVNQAASRANRFVIKAPISGTVLTRPIDPGQFVDTQSVLFTIASGGTPEIEAEIDEADADRVTLGMAVVLSPSGSDVRVNGRVSEVAPQVDATTGGRLIKVIPADSGPRFLPGRTTDLNIILARRENALSVPRSALVGGNQVQVIDEEGRISYRTVTLLDWPGATALVQSGLRAGERIVLAPLPKVSRARYNPVERPAVAAKAAS
jgi:multidrug efflux pump subunit AcrA (membrane-fusion protein)